MKRPSFRRPELAAEEAGLAQPAECPESGALRDEGVQQHHPAERRPGGARGRRTDLGGRALDAHLRQRLRGAPQHRLELCDDRRQRAHRVAEQAVDREHQQASRHGQGLEHEGEAAAALEGEGRRRRRQQGRDRRWRAPGPGRTSARRPRPARAPRPLPPRRQSPPRPRARRVRRARPAARRPSAGRSARANAASPAARKARSGFAVDPLQQRRHRITSGLGLAPAGLSAGRCTAGARGSAPA